jgi:hypothetical protein
MTGSGFTGSQGLNTFRGGFNGNWAGTFSGGGGYRGGTAAGSSASNAGGAGTTSAFSAYNVNPLAPGAPTLTRVPDFTSPISAGTGTGNLAGGGYGGSGYGGGGGLGSLSAGSSGYGSNLSATPTGTGSGNRRTAYPYYTASPTFDYRPAGPNVIQSEVRGVLARSASLSPNRDIRVTLEGPAVVLRGTVPSEQDRRLAEALVRLTPGVHEVQNKLEVAGSKPQPRPGP